MNPPDDNDQASARRGILAGGNWIVDLLKTVDVYPAQDALANILDESVGNGGSPFNILADLARLGAVYPLMGIGLTGDDPEGTWIRERCAELGIDATRLGVCREAHTSYTVVVTARGTGRRTFFHQRGANAFLTAEHFDFTGCTARIFHLGYLLLLDGLDAPDAEYGTAAARVLARARAAGCRTSVDVVSEDSDRFTAVVLPSLPHVDYCILNEFELERTTGIVTRPGDVLDASAVEAGARQLLQAGVREWVVVHYPEGACAVGRADGGRAYRQGSVRLAEERIVSTVGAGDAFAAGVLHGLHEGEGIERALLYGVCAAAACLGGRGTSDGVRPLAECLAEVERLGFRVC